MRPHVSVVLPALNEAGRIGSILDDAGAFFRERGLAYELIVVADGTDATRDIARGRAETEGHIAVLGSAQRRGKGYGIRQGVAQAQGKIIGFADADNKTPFEQLDKFLEQLEAGADIVIGSRKSPESLVERSQPLYRRWGGKAYRAVLRMMIGLGDLDDTQCGFKFFRGAVAKQLFGLSKIDGYMFDAEVLYLARQAGYSIGQVPIRWKDDGDSRLNVVSDIFQDAVDMMRLRFSFWSKRSPKPTALPALLEDHA